MYKMRKCEKGYDLSFICDSTVEMTQYLQKMLNKQRFKLTPEFYTKSYPRASKLLTAGVEFFS